METNNKASLNGDIRAGYVCSSCGLFVKAYSRKLNSSMARVLLMIYRSGKRDFFHVENWITEVGLPELRADYHKLRFWGLLEKQVEDREDGSPRNGLYKITGRGILFAENKMTVQERAIIFDNKFLGYEGEEISIQKALTAKFSYSELMTS